MTKRITSVTEYILCYAKDKTKVTYNNCLKRRLYQNTYKNPDNDPRVHGEVVHIGLKIL